MLLATCSDLYVNVNRPHSAHMLMFSRFVFHVHHPIVVFYHVNAFNFADKRSRKLFTIILREPKNAKKVSKVRVHPVVSIQSGSNIAAIQ